MGCSRPLSYSDTYYQVGLLAQIGNKRGWDSPFVNISPLNFAAHTLMAECPVSRHTTF